MTEQESPPGTAADDIILEDTQKNAAVPPTDPVSDTNTPEPASTPPAEESVPAADEEETPTAAADVSLSPHAALAVLTAWLGPQEYCEVEQHQAYKINNDLVCLSSPTPASEGTGHTRVYVSVPDSFTFMIADAP